MPKSLPSRAKLDKKLVDSMPNTTAGQRASWDTEVKGFGLLVGKREKSFFVQREIRVDGKRRCRRQTLGRYGLDVTVVQARDKAREQIVRFKKRLDLDPKAEAARQAVAAKGCAGAGDQRFGTHGGCTSRQARPRGMPRIPGTATSRSSAPILPIGSMCRCATSRVPMCASATSSWRRTSQRDATPRS